MTKIIETNIESLVPDNKNFNKGTEYGDRLMDESLRKFGLARSIVIDKNNRIIVGNKTAEKPPTLVSPMFWWWRLTETSLSRSSEKTLTLIPPRGVNLRLRTTPQAKPTLHGMNP